MSTKLITALVLGISLISFVQSDDDEGHHHVLIHVPYHIKTIKHTHTITKHIHHKDDSGDKIEVLGYTVGHPIKLDHGIGHEDKHESGDLMDLIKQHAGWGGDHGDYGGHENFIGAY